MTGQNGSRPGVAGAVRTVLDHSRHADETRIAIRCNVCRRWLTDPKSVIAGAGPTCRGKHARGSG